MNNTLNLKHPNFIVKPRPIKATWKLCDQLHTKLRQDQASGRVYKSSDTSACAIFMIAMIDEPNDVRFLHDLLASNSKTIMEPPNIPDQSRIIKPIDRYPCSSTIDLSDRYHDIRIQPHNVKHTAFCTLDGTYGTRLMQQGECNAPVTCQKIMNHDFRDELVIYVDVYIDDIFIFSKPYEKHLAYLRTLRYGSKPISSIHLGASHSTCQTTWVYEDTSPAKVASPPYLRSF